MYKNKALTQFYLTGQARTPKKKWTPSGLYSALQPRRIVRLGVRTVGYLAASARLVDRTFGARIVERPGSSFANHVEGLKPTRSA